MEKELDDYLSAVEKHLKLLPVSERVDIIKELKSYMEELQLNDKKTTIEIIEGLGSPKELAKEYLGSAITKHTGFNFKKILMIFSFWSLMGLVNIWLIPTGLLVAVTLMFSGIASPIAGIIKVVSFLLHIDMPYIVFNLGGKDSHPFVVLLFSILLGISLYFIGKYLWKLTLKYTKSIINFQKHLNS